MNPTFRRPVHRGFALRLLLLLLGPSTVGCAYDGGGPRHAATAEATAAENCFAKGQYVDREACFARMPASDLAACARSAPERCLPYVQMHELEKRLEAALNVAGRNLGSDSLDALSALHSEQAAWRAYRDRRCELEPILDGMSRAAWEGLTQQCRLEETRSRMAHMERLVSRLASEDAR